MTAVDALTKEQIAEFSNILKNNYSDIYFDTFKVGVNLGLRISDLLKLKYKDINYKTRELQLIEQKTGKKKTLRLNSQALAIIEQRRSRYPDDRYVLQVHSNRQYGEPISRASIARVFKEAGDKLGLHVSTHSMRKSRGMALYDAGVPIEKIAMVLNHSSPANTLLYLGITKRQILDTYDEYEL